MLNLNGLPAGSLLRVSTADQAHNGTSLREQSETARGYIERSGMVLVREYVEEDGISGRAEDRPDVDALVADVEAGLVKVVVVHRIDRGARDLRLLLNIIHRIESAGGLVLSATQFYDPTTPEGRLMRNMLGATAELDRDHIVKRLSDGVRRVAREGHWPGGVPPYGLARRRTEADKHTRVVLDEAEAETARTAAALLVDDGLSADDAAARLNALGHRTRTGTRWGPKSLRRMLLADHLTGTYLWAAGSRSPSKSEPVAIPVPAVFSPERHAEVRLALGPEAVPATPKGRSLYVLSRRIASPCGKHYWGRPFGRDGARRYFCSDDSTRCGCPRLDAERVEGRVWQEVAALLTDPERLTAMARDHLATQAERVGRRRDDLSAVEAKIAKLERALNETVVDYAREGVPAAVVRAATDTLAGELSQLRRHRADLVRWRSAEEASDRHAKRLWALARTALDRLHTMGDDERAALLAMLAVQVTVTGTTRCPQCDGRGRVGGRRGGYRCGRCRGMRTLVDLRIDGEVMDDLGDTLGAGGRRGDLVPMPSAVPCCAGRTENGCRRVSSICEARWTVSPSSPRVLAFLIAEAVSALGSFATMVVIWGYAAYEFDASPGQVSLFGLAFALPGVVLGPLTGTIVDRMGPKPTLAASKVIGVVASLLLLAADDFTTMAMLSALHGTASALGHPALQSMPPRLVDERHLARTNALVSLTDELSIVLGPAVAGVAIALVGFRGAFVFDALTYALGLVVLPVVRLRARAVADGEDEEPVRWRDALEGWRLVSRRPTLRRVVQCTAAVHLLYGVALLAEPLYVRDVLQRSEHVFAALQTAFGLCLVGAGLVVARLGDRLASLRFVALGVAGSGVAALVYLGTPSVVVAFAGVAVWGLVTAAISGPARTVLQRSSPERAHGRVMAADMLAANAAMLLGTAAAGPVIEAVGVPWTVAGFGLTCSVVGVVTLASDHRDRERPGTRDTASVGATAA